MTYFAYIKNSDDANEIKIQEESIKNYTNKLNIRIIKTYKIETIDFKKIDKYFEKALNELDHGNGLIISNMSSLGNSTNKILQRILQLKEKKITLHSVEDKFILPFDNEELYKLVKAVVSADKTYKDKRVELAKISREKSGKKIGRKAGKKTKSIFDKHKNRIFKLYELKVPKTKILEDIKEKDENLKNTTIQAIGLYIKRVEAKKEIKAQKNQENKKKLKQEKAKKLEEAVIWKHITKKR